MPRSSHSDDEPDGAVLPKDKLISLCKYDPILKWMRGCDHILYQALVEILIPDVLRPVPSKRWLCPTTLPPTCLSLPAPCLLLTCTLSHPGLFPLDGKSPLLHAQVSGSRELPAIRMLPSVARAGLVPKVSGG